MSTNQLFGTLPAVGASVTLVVPSVPIVVVLGAAGARFVAKVVVFIVAVVSDVEPSSTVTPV